MLGALIIVFREVIEAGLIVGIVLAVTRGVPGRGQWVTAGVLLGTFGAGLIAIFAETIANAFAGSGQEMFNASVLGVAVAMLMWHNLWMASHGQEMAASMAAVGKSVTASRWWLALQRCARVLKWFCFSMALSRPARPHHRCCLAVRWGS
jgi:high-affinity iron transporter